MCGEWHHLELFSFMHAIAAGMAIHQLEIILAEKPRHSNSRPMMEL